MTTPSDPCCAPEDPCCPPAAEQLRPPLSDAEANEELARYAKALAHPARVAIVRLLMQRKTCIVGEIVDRAPAGPVDGLSAPEATQGRRPHPRRCRRATGLLLHRACTHGRLHGARRDPVDTSRSHTMGIFERFLSLWVGLAIAAGVGLGLRFRLSSPWSLSLSGRV